MPLVFNYIPIECLHPGRYQPRQDFDAEQLQGLADSIASQGLIEPLVVREIAPEHYEIIAGERRWRASMLAQLTTLPCLIGDYNEEQAAAITLIENIQRQDLNLIEEAHGYHQLTQTFHFHQDEVAHLVGKSRSHVANVLRLLSLTDTVQEQLRQRHLSLGHARMLVGLSPSQQHDLAMKVIQDHWSVRRLEDAVRQLKTQTIPPTGSHDVTRIETLLSEHMGAPVQIESSSTHGGWLKIKFFDNDTLTGLLEQMGLRYD